MDSVIIIPARFASARYPGKPLVGLRGARGRAKSLIERSWEAAQRVPGVDAVWIATDDGRIAETSRGFGAQVVMTSPDCANGTERCADALARLGINPRVVVNLQGDAPLTPPWFVTDLLAAMAPDVGMATPVLRCDAASHAQFLSDRRAGRVGATTTVFDRAMNALYFSKEVLPHTGRDFAPQERIPVFHHVGVYAYTPDYLKAYAALPAGVLEGLEGLEQLRFLENAMPVRCVEVSARGRLFWELNNPSDVPLIEAELQAQGLD